jgi:hypothetical protein
MRAFFPAAEINYINIHDNHVKVPRKFISLSSEERGRAVNKIYEVVLQGELSVIRKPRGGSLPDFDDVYSYEYFVMESSTVTKLADFRKTIYPIIEHHYSPKQMMKFLNYENLNPWSPADAIKLIDIYNDRLPIDASNISARR